MRYFLRLSYNGDKFHGWQYQPNAITVQQKIEEALSIVTRLPISIVGAGRTDAGVHAREMFAHFDLPQPVEDKERMLKSLNRIVGNDIALYELIDVSSDAHARFDASERTYKYFISYEKNPFMYPYSWHSPTILDIDKMNEAAQLLLQVRDFTSFAKLHSDVKTNICDVRAALWTKHKIGRDSSCEIPFVGEGMVFTISADRFLRNMVRAVVGTLVEVGRGKLSVDGFYDVINKKDRCVAGVSMPTQALFLWSVRYPFIF